jgi:hypothetical protein
MRTNSPISTDFHAACQRIDIRLSLLIRAILALTLSVSCAAWWLQ